MVVVVVLVYKAYVASLLVLVIFTSHQRIHFVVFSWVKETKIEFPGVI